jgi:uncharacterized protein (TIGR02996 family)
MEPEDAALWRAVLAAPHDDAPRLILADWLEEAGHTDRAEFVRVQCRLARMEEDHPQRPGLEMQELILWVRNRKSWRASLASAFQTYLFRRGFVYPRNVPINPGDFERLGEEVLLQAPLWEVRMGLTDSSTVDRLAQDQHLRQIAGLELDCAGVYVGNLARLMASQYLENVRELVLRGGPIGPDHLRAIAAAPALHHLKRLAIFSNSLGRDGAAVLAAAEGLRNLDVLELVHCRLGDDGLRVLLASPYLTGLKELRVPTNRLTVGAVRALAECRHLRGLRVLDLTDNHLDDDGARVLALCPAMDRLTRLDLGWNRIHRAGAEYLAASPFLVRVRHLSLLGNPCAYESATVSGLRFRFSDRVALAEI